MLVRYFDPILRPRRRPTLLDWSEPWAMPSVAEWLRDSLQLLDSGFGGHSGAPLVSVDDGVARIEIVAPGLDPEKDLEVELAGRTLSVTGGRQQNGEDENGGARRWSRFAYRWNLGRDIDPKDIRADYRAGILTIEVQLGEAGAEKTRIPVGGGTLTAGGEEEAAGNTDTTG